MIIKDSGRKFLELRFQIHGKRREMGLGGYPQLDLKNHEPPLMNTKSRSSTAQIP